MPTAFLKTVLFATSFMPAVAIIGLRVAIADPLLALKFGSLSIALGVAAGASYWLLGATTAQRYTIVTAEPLREAFTGFLLGYVLPFILIDLSDTSAVIASVAFVLILGAVYVRSNLVYLNPLLALAGNHLFAVTATLDGGPPEPVSLLLLTAERHLRKGDVVFTRGADQEIRFAKKGS